MGSLARPVVVIVTPGTRDANNGNWRTAARWAAMLRDRCRVIVQTQWDGEPADALLALHARRSADSVKHFHAGGKPVAVVLTGTDLYKDLPHDAEAIASLDRASRIVVLQEDALRLLSPRWQRVTRVIYQSARALSPARKRPGRLDCVVVGHLREEKDPRTLFRAIESLPPALPIVIRHIGGALDAGIAAEAAALQRWDPRYRYAGALPHGLARAAIKAAHVLIHPSIMEGGANVIVEAVTAGTPVLASRISGNVGMLGVSYHGYFESRDASGLAGCLVQLLQQREFARRLARECASRRKLFTPEAEQRALRRLVAEMLA